MNFSHELITPNNDLPFKIFEFEGRDGHYYREKHWHRSIEIFALFEGSLCFYINDRAYPLKPGEFMLVNSHEIHSIASPEPNHTVVLQMPLTTFANYYTDDKFIYFSHSAKLQDEKVMALIRDMYETYQEKTLGYELKVQSDFYMLIYLLVTKYRKTEVNREELQRSRGQFRLSAVTSYMKENYMKDLSLESVAEVFGYSPTYLSRMFQKYAQTKYKTYLNQIRLEHAYIDLMNSDMTIGEIAMRSGFPNSNALTKEFKARYGLLPSEFRKKEKDKNLI